MACVALRCGGGNAFLSRLNGNSDQQQQQQPQPQRSCSYKRNPTQAVLKSNSQQSRDSTTRNPWKLPPMAPVVYENLSFCREESNGCEKGEITSETLDVWMRDSVTEIVKNIREAPFLVHVFSSTKNGKTKVTCLNRQKAVADEWLSTKRRWEEREERGEFSTPDGIILIEELKDENEEEYSEGRGKESSTRAWGIVIQGKSVNCNPACYILKTCRVGSPSIGFCTHYCLVKAQLCGETALQQMKNSWLLNPQLLYQHSYYSDFESTQ
ncbi:uncharacterized protein LOC122670362 [Telopea speciosissima]|uniref:uncharacterized protein LOC122670362 n=1 Tax=Telopea speciosissima TaxID=54955 RepID=UPI001CC6F26A|nr:uncharacterized protein LOC122670362 [Telopea speciosissima]